MMLSIMEDLQKVSDNFRGWIIEHSSPALMIAVLVIGLAVFFITYGALHKND